MGWTGEAASPSPTAPPGTGRPFGRAGQNRFPFGESKRSIASAFSPSVYVAARLIEQGGIGEHLLGDKPMQRKATLVEASMVLNNPFHPNIVAQVGRVQTEHAGIR